MKELEKRIHDNNNGLDYELVGGVYLPDIRLEEGEQQPIGIWGQRHKRYLKENHKALYQGLLLSGNLNSHLVAKNENAETMLLNLMQVMADEEGITEVLKASAPWDWITKMNSVKARAEEIIYNEVIYCIV